jgi:hypothetical protein
MTPGEIRACYRACTPALKGWRVTSATATQTTTCARPSLGLSVVCERCWHRSLPSCSVAAFWWSAEATGGRNSAMGKSRPRKAEEALPWRGLAWGAGAGEQNRNANSGSCKRIVWLWRHSPTCMRRAI